MAKLGVNIDHVATVRQQRKGLVPDPVQAALAVEQAGADGIVAHLREDRRHIQDQDIRLLKTSLNTRLSMEMGATESIVALALDVRPYRVCLVPEKRRELTTEGGLDVLAQRVRLQKIIKRFRDRGIEVSLFVDPQNAQVKCAHDIGAQTVELHTGAYADATSEKVRERELAKLKKASEMAVKLNLRLHAGHGLDYRNASAVAEIDGMEELNIGFSIIARSLFVGLETAVRDMKQLIG